MNDGRADEAIRLIGDLERTADMFWRPADVAKLPAAKVLLDAVPDLKIAALREIATRLGNLRKDMGDSAAPGGFVNPTFLNLHHRTGYPRGSVAIGGKLLAAKLPFNDADLCHIVGRIADLEMVSEVGVPFLPSLLRVVENHATTGDLSLELRGHLVRLHNALSFFGNKPEEKLRERIAGLLSARKKIPLLEGERWADSAIAYFNSRPPAEKDRWAELLDQCGKASGGKPNAKWTKAVRGLIGHIGVESFCAGIVDWFPLTALPRTKPALSEIEWQARCMYDQLAPNWQTVSPLLPAGKHLWQFWNEMIEAAAESGDVWAWLLNFHNQPEVRAVLGDKTPALTFSPTPPLYDAPEDNLISEPHMDILRGLAWACGLFPSPELARAVKTLTLSAYRKVPGKGPRAVRVGNACITALGMMPGLDAVGQLALLKVKVKFGTAQKAIDKALTAAAAREGLPREKLEEMAVPAYGLTEVGRLVETLGEFTAELAVTGSKTAAIIWRRADGKVQKSLPAAVKQEFAEKLKELNAAKKDIENMLPAQAERIDSLFLQQKTWPLETWLERYLEHPLTGTLARRLIWNFTTGGVTTPGLWLNGKVVDRLGHPVPLDAGKTSVALWHPLDQAADVVLGWRGFLEEWQIVQPFKQAHREVYLLTPAEERTGTYSNRFAAHILKQHQFHALAAARGWKNKLRLRVDAEYPPASRRLPRWGLRAEFWIEGAGEETNESGSYLYLATDQVRFYRSDAEQVSAHAGGGGYSGRWRQNAAEPLPLTEIPPLVFSEIMRDVDLFVGVASVGNDPAWADGGRRDAERNAWNLHAFGDLSATAQTRRDLLQRLVPKLKIAERCSFAEKFLVVRGDLRTYKIHLGSGNILMAPNDQYLCIVPGSAGKAEDGKFFLPFEGDRTLSVILSKAFLLAADAKITDPSITRQIQS